MLSRSFFEHTKRNYLRDEFAAITNKIDEAWPHSEKLKMLLDENASLDNIFDSVSIPVLLTYDSNAINNHNRVTKDFSVAFEEEVRQNWEKFKGKNLPHCIDINLILMPLRSKEEIQKKLHRELQKWN